MPEGSGCSGHNDLSILFYNVQGLRGKVSQFEAFLVDKGAHILCLNEHWLNRDEMDTLNIAGFVRASSFCRTVHLRGGVGIFVNCSLKIMPLPFDAEDLSVEVHFEVTGIIYNDVQVITVYRSPSGDFDLYISKLSDLLDRLDLKKGIVIAGDFNVHFELESRESQVLVDLLGSFGLLKTVTNSTRGSACLDNVFTNLGTELCSWRTIDPNMSDHLAIAFTVKNRSLPISNKRIIYRPITEMGLFTLYNHILKVDWSFINDCNINCDGKFGQFLDVLTKACDASFPEKSRLLSSSHGNTHKINWFNEELKQMREVLRLLTCINKSDCSIVSNDCLRSFRKDYRNSIDRCKRIANDKHISSGTASRAIWDVIKSNNPTTKKCYSDTLSADDFNKFFANIAKDTIDSLPTVDADPLDHVEVYMSCKNPDVFSFQEVSYSCVRDIITNLKSSPSRDFYGLNARIMKTLKHIIVFPLTNLINQCIISNTFPDCLKIARVVPVFKKGCCDVVGNYRPISVVPILGKIFETVLKQQLTKHLEESGLLNTAQFGFRSNMSTTTAISRLTHFIQGCFEDKAYAYASFFDLTKAFDCVSHDLLTLKLHKYNFNSNSVALIQSYLSQRKQYVSYNNSNSGMMCVEYGVPQGSVFGPILFLLYVNDISTCIPGSRELVLFADDTTTLESSKDLEQLRRQVVDTQSCIHNWFLCNNLGVNESKIQSLCFSLRTCDSDRKPVRFLGVFLDPKLTWETHCVKLAAKLSRNIFIIRNLRNIVSSEVLLKAYYGYIHTHLTYAVLCWGHSSHMSEAFTIQRRCLRVMAGLRSDQCCRRAFVGMGVLTLPCIYILSCLKHVKKNFNSYSSHGDIHSYNTRHRDDLTFDYKRTQKARDGYNYYAVRFFNVLPTDVRVLSINCFTRKIKDLLKHNAFYSFEEYLLHDFNNIV